jgi:hypothetical protein
MICQKVLSNKDLQDIYRIGTIAAVIQTGINKERAHHGHIHEIQ